MATAKHAAFEWWYAVASSFANTIWCWSAWLIGSWDKAKLKAKAWSYNWSILLLERWGAWMSRKYTAWKDLSICLLLISRDESKFVSGDTLIDIGTHSLGLRGKRCAEICLNIIYSFGWAKSFYHLTIWLSFDCLCCKGRTTWDCTTAMRCLFVGRMNSIRDIKGALILKLTDVQRSRRLRIFFEADTLAWSLIREIYRIKVN